MKLRFRKSFEHDLRRIRDRRVLGRVAKVLRQIEQADSLSDLPDVKPLAGARSDYPIRIGAHRLGIVVGDQEVEIVRFLHRRAEVEIVVDRLALPPTGGGPRAAAGRDRSRGTEAGRSSG